MEKVKVSCFHCGRTNYYPVSASGKKVVCGRCKNALPNPGTTVEPAPQQVFNLIQNSSLPILIDFYSPTYASCLPMHPVVEKLARRRAGELMVLKINISQYPDVGAVFGVQGVPTFLIMHKGTELARSTGAMTEADFALWVASRI